MNIGIIGYGRMGRAIELQACERGHKIVCTVDPSQPKAEFKTLDELNCDLFAKIDVFIEFSLADAIRSNVVLYSREGIPAVIGTTGWDNEKDTVEKIINESKCTCIYGANFSVGAHVFTRIAQHAAKIINALPHYDVALYEIHHTKKKDRPSGTALMAAHRVLNHLTRKTHIVSDIPCNVPIADDALAIVSHRVGYERGFHELILDSDFDTIKVSHTARERTGFALGAVLAAEWVVATHRKNGTQGLIAVDTFIDELIGESNV